MGAHSFFLTLLGFLLVAIVGLWIYVLAFADRRIARKITPVLENFAERHNGTIMWKKRFDPFPTVHFSFGAQDIVLDFAYASHPQLQVANLFYSTVLTLSPCGEVDILLDIYRELPFFRTLVRKHREVVVGGPFSTTDFVIECNRAEWAYRTLSSEVPKRLIALADYQPYLRMRNGTVQLILACVFSESWEYDLLMDAVVSIARGLSSPLST